jgi:hypothetical protein
MKWHISIAVITVLCLCLFCSIPADQAQAQAKKAAPANKPVVMPKITVLNPMGTPPPITRKAMVEPPATLEGKTIYFVNTGYIGTDRLMAVMEEWFKANYPKTNIVVKRSAGGMSGVDKNLWAEIGEKGDAAIVGLGH